MFTFLTQSHPSPSPAHIHSICMWCCSNISAAAGSWLFIWSSLAVATMRLCNIVQILFNTWINKFQLCGWAHLCAHVCLCMWERLCVCGCVGVLENANVQNRIKWALAHCWFCAVALRLPHTAFQHSPTLVLSLSLCVWGLRRHLQFQFSKTRVR